MKKLKLPKFIKDAQVMASKHSPEILVGIGIAGWVTTTVLAVKATPKVLKLIEEKKEEEGKDKLTPIETIKTVWKPCVPVVVTGVAATTCLIRGNSISLRRNAALATAYKISETALTEYKEKVVETIGEKKEQVIKDKIAKKKVEDNPVPTASNSVIITGKGDTLCLDAVFGQYFHSDIESIRKALNDINYRLISEEYVSVNDFYDELGIPHIEIGDRVGWNIGRDGQVDISFSSQIASNGQPCLVIQYLVEPRYDYYKLG